MPFADRRNFAATPLSDHPCPRSAAAADYPRSARASCALLILDRPAILRRVASVYSSARVFPAARFVRVLAFRLAVDARLVADAFAVLDARLAAEARFAPDPRFGVEDRVALEERAAARGVRFAVEEVLLPEARFVLAARRPDPSAAS